MARATKFLRLSWRDKRLVAHSALVVALVRLGLSLFSYKHVRRCPPRRARRVAHADEIARIAWAVRVTAKRIPGATCLTQAIAGQYLLAHAGHDARIRIGVARDADGAFNAHAWLLCNDAVVLGGSDAELRRYSTLTDLEPKPL